MPNYQNGKIYTIHSRSREDLVYVGSTTRRLSERLGEHKRGKKTETSKLVIDIGDSYIELYENFPCNGKEELDKREGEIIRLLDCVNKRIEGRKPKERYEENKEEVLSHMKQYYEEHKEERTLYYENNKQKIKNNQKTQTTCECGGVFRLRSKKRHEKTKNHQKYISERP